MPLPAPAKFCPICGNEIQGRIDKIFCSVSCKNVYHQKRKTQHTPITKPIDSILLRNWVILQEKYEVIGKRKFFISKADLHKSGFHTAYHTTMNINKAGKTYFYIYDFGWMDFSEKELMVIKLNKAK